ncbi:hypothetical protein M9H77_10665 [Catharanthus roseus]|uniref:Uncharacterized protein n=1 Tax=Catharanthus roseus TaxID=4058 RepID=A0ACC0BCE0_CATRO|nr:hypothetical protein M9H77_10665 [Catharanthus roseus]
MGGGGGGDNGEKSSSPVQKNSEEEDRWVSELPRARFWDAMDICLWEGIWFEPGLVKPALNFKTNFEAQNEDILLASPPKTGTTWLKALCLCILKNQNIEDDEKDDVLTKENPHFNVQTIESMIYSTKPNPDDDLYTTRKDSPRLFHTHLPYNVLPDSIKQSDCKIVYITRNPKDTVVSLWHFFNSIFRTNQDPFPLEKAVECFCSGIHQYGPFFDHVLQYWGETQKRPNKILFLKYEDLKKDPKGEVKKLADFLGKPLIDEAEIDKVLWRCSLDRLKNLEVNKNGSILYGVPNSSYFRRGVVGDWKNYLSTDMEKLIDETAKLKFEGSGLHLES